MMKEKLRSAATTVKNWWDKNKNWVKLCAGGMVVSYLYGCLTTTRLQNKLVSKDGKTELHVLDDMDWQMYQELYQMYIDDETPSEYWERYRKQLDGNKELFDKSIERLQD